MVDKASLTLLIQDTENTIFEGPVDRITSYNEMGSFDIYPLHANFISIITKEIDIYQEKKLIKKIPIQQAILKVKKDNVHIYLGIEMFYLEDIDPLVKHVQPVKKKWWQF